MTSPRLVSANRNPALPDGIPRYAHLFGAQSERRLASCTGPFSPQPLPTTDPFLYGDSCLCPGRHPSWGLCDVTGPSRPSYLHILIHRRDLRWIRFVWQGRAGQGRAECFSFGRSPSAFPWPLGFSPVTRELHGRSRGVRVHVYLDDWRTHRTSVIPTSISFDSWPVVWGSPSTVPSRGLPHLGRSSF